MNLLILPRELLGEIMGYLPRIPFSRLAATCKMMDQILWSFLKTLQCEENFDIIPLRHIHALETLETGRLHAHPNLTKLTNLKSLKFTYDISLEEETNMLRHMTYLHQLTIKPRGSPELDLAPILCDHTRLTSFTYSPVETCKSLHGLHVLTRLQYCSIQFSTELNDEHLLPIMDITSLTSLELTWLNSMTNKTVQHLTRLVNLEHVELVNCGGLSDADYTVLQHLTKLTFADLSYNPIHPQLLESIATLTHLTTLLILEDVMPVDTTPRDFQALTKLAKLRELSFVIQRPAALNLAAFVDLQQITLNASTQLSELVALPHLRLVQVETTSFSAAEVVQLCKLTQIRQLHLRAVKSFDTETFARHCSDLKSLLELFFFPSEMHKPKASMDEFCEALVSVPYLSTLSLPEITATTVPSLTRLPNLVVLRLLTMYDFVGSALPFIVEEF